MFGDTVGEDDLSGDAVLGEHFHSLTVIPGPCKFLLDRRTPCIVDLFDQELLFGFIHHIDLHFDGHVDEIMVFGFYVGLVLRNWQACVAIGGDNSQTFAHGLPLFIST